MNQVFVKTLMWRCFYFYSHLNVFFVKWNLNSVSIKPIYDAKVNKNYIT